MTSQHEHDEGERVPLVPRAASAAASPKRVRAGVNVLVGTRHERFWCLVRRVDVDGTIHAIIDNEPVVVHSHWRRGDAITFRGEHVWDVADESDRAAFLGLFAALGCEVGAAVAWREGRGLEG